MDQDWTVGLPSDLGLKVSRGLGFRVISSEELCTLGVDGFGLAVQESVGQRAVFLSFDVDFFDPACAPGPGTPEVGDSPQRKLLLSHECYVGSSSPG